MIKQLLKGLSKEQIAKVSACNSVEELLNLAKAEGVELTDEQLEAVNGGGCSSFDIICPNCGYSGQHNIIEGAGYKKLFCGSCGQFIKDL